MSRHGKRKTKDLANSFNARNPPGTHFLYLIATLRDGQFVAPVKVGITGSVANRLATIQTSCPFEVGLVHAIAFPGAWMARKIERDFHTIQAKNRSFGEWFEISPRKALGILILYLRWTCRLEGMDDDLVEQVVEMSGAGDTAIAVINSLPSPNAADLQ